MRVAIVYESLFGNTHEIAEALAAGVADARPDATIELMRVGKADLAHVAQVSLLIVGGPTHMRSMTRGMSRTLGISAEAKKTPGEGHEVHGPEPDASGPGVREWLHRLPRTDGGRRAAAFDTRLGAWMAGGAAHGIAHRLRSAGYELIAEPEGFVVEDAEGPLRACERERARAWAAGLAFQLHAAVPGPTTADQPSALRTATQ
jgi:hypothetical protein